jgi:hypothetical protein
MRKSLFAVFACFVIVSANGQDSRIRYVVSKDTVQSGEIYTKMIYVDLAVGDSILYFQVRSNELNLKTERGSSEIGFAAFHMGPTYKEIVKRKEIPLKIRLKTLKIDTVITSSTVYYTRPGPAYVRSLNTQFPYKCEVYPTSKPKLKNFSGDIKHLLCNTVLKGQKGELAFTFVVNTKGLVEYPIIHLNTFSIKADEILQALERTRWTIGMNQNKYVNSLQGEIIQIQ